ncbi:MAG: hypothetical protein JXR70_15025 [Spirochaetales bacterium]|nr:hypothetical protein [Spirochaetales bacterium]
MKPNTAFLICFFLLFTSLANAQNRPFPQNLNYPNTIKPQLSQSQLNSDVQDYYNYWKNAYLKPANLSGAYYIAMFSNQSQGDFKTSSEATGYGMLITATMAGYDTNARTYFDGLYRLYNAHRSRSDNNLMSWKVGWNESSSDDDSCATDGDMDIAYGLMLAHYQWGSNGSINYINEARRIINAMMNTCVDGGITILGDWVKSNGGYSRWGSRSSDWMGAHFKVYSDVSGNNNWLNIKNQAYQFYSQFTDNYSQNTGLIADFIVNNPPRPASPNHLERDKDGEYSWNACRFPLRLAADYAHTGDERPKTAINKLLNWLKSSTNNNPSQIRSGYSLSGSPHATYFSGAFASPMVAAAIVDPAHQNFLTSGWNVIKNARSDYYPDNLTLLSMLLISGNYWLPEENINTPTPTLEPTPAPQGVLGDVDNNRVVNIVDALLIAQAYVGQPQAGYNPAYGDVDCNGAVNIVDALLIAQYYVGLVQGFC